MLSDRPLTQTLQGSRFDLDLPSSLVPFEGLHRQSAQSLLTPLQRSLRRFLQITFLRFSATTLPLAADDSGGSLRSNHFETVEHDWGKARSKGSGSRGEGVRTVTGLPLEVLGESAPSSLLDEEGGLAQDVGNCSLRHKTSSGSKMSLSRKPSLSTVDERIRPPFASHSVSPGATLLGNDSQLFCSPSRTYNSPLHTPRILDSPPTSFPFPFASSSAEGDHGSPVARGRRMGRRSQESIIYPRDEPTSDPRFDEVRGVGLGAVGGP
jgi:hypothetical protein